MNAAEAAEQHAELHDKIAETQDAVSALSEQNRLIADLTRQLDTVETHLHKLDDRREAELRDVEKYRDSSTRRLLHKAVGRSAAFDERAAKEEREYHDVLEESQRQQKAAESLRQRIQEAATARDDIEGQVQLHRAAQRDLDDLYADIFSGQQAGEFAAVDEKSSASDHALQQYFEVRDTMDKLEEASQLLAKALTRPPVAHRHYELAAAHSNAQCLAEANKAISEMEELIHRAQDLSPVVGHVPSVRRTIGAQFHQADVVSALVFHDEVKTAQDGLKRVVVALEGYEQEAIAQIESLSPELKTKEDELERTRLELQLERQKVFSKVLSRQGRG